LPNGIAISGGNPKCQDAVVETHGDHRTAMAAAVLAAPGCLLGQLLERWLYEAALADAMGAKAA